MRPEIKAHEETTEITPHEADENRWLIPYGNAMTILMVFFLILYAFTYWIGDVKYEKILASIQKDLIKFDDEMFERIHKKEKEADIAIDLSKKVEEMGLERFMSIKIDAQMIRLSLPSPVLFERGEAYLREEAKMVLKEIAKIIKDIPNKVIIEGHTCNIPIAGGKYRSNWELSISRAVSVISYFANEEGIPQDRFIAAGYGEFRPVAPNTTELNRAKNRRIEIVIIRTA